MFSHIPKTEFKKSVNNPTHNIEPGVYQTFQVQLNLLTCNQRRNRDNTFQLISSIWSFLFLHFIVNFTISNFKLQKDKSEKKILQNESSSDERNRKGNFCLQLVQDRVRRERERSRGIRELNLKKGNMRSPGIILFISKNVRERLYRCR